MRGLIMVGVLSVAGAWAARENRSNVPGEMRVNLDATVIPSALRDASQGPLHVAGKAAEGVGEVCVRVMTGRGVLFETSVTVSEGAFACRYPGDFSGAPPLEAGMYFVDAAEGGEGAGGTEAGSRRAEAAVIVYDSAEGRVPDLPGAFMADLLDREGRVDARSAEWPVVRSLVNHYMHSRGAKLAGVGRGDFDLAVPADLQWFKDNLTLYEFDHRDRDWTAPLGHRVARAFWQSVWNTWFNSGNDHPWDGNPENRARSNYIPYAFANDFSDTLIVQWMRTRCAEPLDDNLRELCREGTRNEMAMQHREDSNFALTDHRGLQETYTRGAFRYGMFENGEFMTEGKGWFYNTKFLDYIMGGVFNGRAAWSLGVALRHDPRGPEAEDVQDAIAACARFCLRDALETGYARKTRGGGVLWKTAGEHAYLLLGMLAACEAEPGRVVWEDRGRPVDWRALCESSLDALVEARKSGDQWSVYTNEDPMAIVALLEGARILGDHPRALLWRKAAVAAAEGWMEAGAADYPAPLVHMGLRVEPRRMTFNWSALTRRQEDNYNVIHFYLTGHWIHALAYAYAATGEGKFRDRAEAMIRYLCGANPWRVRLFNETGGVYNWVEDTDGDGREDWLKQDMYPESTAFCQIGILHLLQLLAAGNVHGEDL